MDFKWYFIALFYISLLVGLTIFSYFFGYLDLFSIVIYAFYLLIHINLLAYKYT